MTLAHAARELCREVARLRFAPPVTHVYNPLAYATELHEAYLARYGAGPKEVVLLGMNPGPFGMAQSGVPFGDVRLVREFLGLDGKVGRPAVEHPERPVTGLACPRSEVSGTRLWGAVRDHFRTPEAFFARFFVANYCPLAFMEASGRNRTPDKLPTEERDALYAACDRHLVRVVETLAPRHVVGVGAFAEQRARAALSGHDLRVGRIPHPSPASPAANQDWAGAARRALEQLGICGEKR
ncbi:MAG: single-stranded DNA-binding protein [Deltaproteobacteria bacterium]|nr:single-stranded DNA-binding protein [Deltaproteobacteria bacterium]